MKIFYRLCLKENDKPRPEWYSKELCFRSFWTSLKTASLTESLYVIVDGKVPSWVKVAKRIINLSDVGSTVSFEYAYREALRSPDLDWIYFSEDDYLYLPTAMERLISAIWDAKGIDYISLYDHPDRYSDLPEHNFLKGMSRILVLGGRHWRSAPSTCMTFAASIRALRDDQGLFKEWTNCSWELFPKLQQLKGNMLPHWRLITPIPSLATHCESEFLAPCVDWDKVAQWVNKNGD